MLSLSRHYYVDNHQRCTSWCEYGEISLQLGNLSCSGVLASHISTSYKASKSLYTLYTSYIYIFCHIIDLFILYVQEVQVDQTLPIGRIGILVILGSF